MVPDSRPTLFAITALIFSVTGLTYTVGSVPVTAHIIRERDLPVIFGIPFYQGSFFVRRGMNWVIASSIAFIIIGLADPAVGYLIWNSFKRRHWQWLWSKTLASSGAESPEYIRFPAAGTR